jgi:hypothetical protein
VQSVECQPTFRRTYRLHFQGRKISWARNQCESRWQAVNRRIGGTYRLHLQSKKNKLSKKPVWKVASRLPPAFTLVFWSTYFFYSEDGGDMFSETSVDNGLHGVISRKMVLFITTAVRTSNPTIWILIEILLSSVIPRLASATLIYCVLIWRSLCLLKCDET